MTGGSSLRSGPVPILVVIAACADTSPSPEPVPPVRTRGAAETAASTAPTPTKDAEGSAAVATPVDEKEPAIAWESLQPVYYARGRDETIWVEIPEPDPKVAAKYASDSYGPMKFPRTDARLPERVSSVESVVVLAPGKRWTLDAPTSVLFNATPMGNGWAVGFAYPGGEEVDGIALPRAPHPDCILDGGRESVAKGELRRILVDSAPKRHRPTAALDVSADVATARLPDGATQVVAGHWDDYERTAYAVVLTLDAEGNPVHTFEHGRDYITWSSVEWVADLDGDGTDEIGWGVGGSEDESYYVTHFEAGGPVHTQLYAQGH